MKKDLNEWMEKNRWNNSSLGRELARLGTYASHSTIRLWRQGGVTPRQETLQNFSKIAGFKAELFFITKNNEEKLIKLVAKYGEKEALNVMFS